MDTKQTLELKRQLRRPRSCAEHVKVDLRGLYSRSAPVVRCAVGQSQLKGLDCNRGSRLMHAQKRVGRVLVPLTSHRWRIFR
jgi:hypothetical protein